MTWQNSQVNIYIYIYFFLLLGWSMGKYYVIVTESQKSVTVVTEMVMSQSQHVTKKSADEHENCRR